MANTSKFYAKDRSALREWLEKNSNNSTGAWLVYDKLSSGKRTLSYDDIVEEVLCFGWIDSLPRSLDNTQAMYYISPRKPKSPWSKLNKERVEKLISEKKMTKAGLDVTERSKRDGSWDAYNSIENLEMPLDLQKEFIKNKVAEKNFLSFSNSNKKQILWYITSAKQESTRKMRIEKILAAVEKNVNPLTYRKKR